MVYRVGLTGGIASGKSTVCEMFRENGIDIIDADQISHQLIYPESPALLAVVDAFGDGVLNDLGDLNRGKLRELVFNDPDRRRQLESILHPMILDEMKKRVQSSTSSYCILDIPLLIEQQLQAMVDRVVVIDVPSDTQRQRLRNRETITEPMIDAILASQLDRSERMRQADDVIDNSMGLEQTRVQVEELHRFYLTLVAQQGT